MPQAERTFFDAFAMQTELEWSAQDTLTAHRLWHDFTVRQRILHLPKRPIADLFIAAFAEKTSRSHHPQCRRLPQCRSGAAGD